MKSVDTIIGGRPAVVTDIGRVRRKKGWGWYSIMSVRFTDNGEYHSMGAAEFARWSTKLDREERNRIRINPQGEVLMEALRGSLEGEK